MRAGADKGTRASAMPARARGQGRTRAQGQGQGQGWIDIVDSISGSRSGTRGMHYDDDDDNDAMRQLSDGDPRASTMKQGQLRRFGVNGGEDNGGGEGNCDCCSDDKEGDMVMRL